MSNGCEEPSSASPDSASCSLESAEDLRGCDEVAHGAALGMGAAVLAGVTAAALLATDASSAAWSQLDEALASASEFCCEVICNLRAFDTMLITQ